MSKSCQACGLHPSLPLEHGDAGDVHCTPGGAWPAGSKSDLVSLAVDTSPDTVDPAHAQRLVHRLRPRQAGIASVSLLEPDDELMGGRGVFVEPAPERCCTQEVDWFGASGH